MTTVLTDPIQLISLLIKAGLLFMSLLTIIFTWVGMRRIQLLNEMLHTPLNKLLALSAFLFFIFSLVTFIIMTLLWIMPFF